MLQKGIQGPVIYLVKNATEGDPGPPQHLKRILSFSFSRLSSLINMLFYQRRSYVFQSANCWIVFIFLKRSLTLRNKYKKIEIFLVIVTLRRANKDPVIVIVALRSANKDPVIVVGTLRSANKDPVRFYFSPHYQLGLNAFFHSILLWAYLKYFTYSYRS